MQLIFQDPYSSLDPRMKVLDLIAEPLRAYRVCRSQAEYRQRVASLLQAVELPPEAMDRYAHQFSGGQRQRIGIAERWPWSRESWSATSRCPRWMFRCRARF